jgi:hypothetical protein
METDVNDGKDGELLHAVKLTTYSDGVPTVSEF